VAQAAHAAAIEATVDGAITDAGIKPQQLSAVAVTIGPGLSLCLQVSPAVTSGVRGGVDLWVDVLVVVQHTTISRQSTAMGGRGGLRSCVLVTVQYNTTVGSSQQHSNGLAAIAMTSLFCSTRPPTHPPRILQLAAQQLIAWSSSRGFHTQAIQSEPAWLHALHRLVSVTP
jgi:hypothetical protein